MFTGETWAQQHWTGKVARRSGHAKEFRNSVKESSPSLQIRPASPEQFAKAKALAKALEFMTKLHGPKKGLGQLIFE